MIATFAWFAFQQQGDTMLRRSCALSMVMLFAGLSWGVNAAAQSFFVTYNTLSVASCDSTHIQGTVNASYVLPATANNLSAFVSLNGGPVIATFYTQNPPTFTGPYTFFYPIPGTSQPYTISANVLPAQNGSPTGAGVSATYVCNVDGSVSSVFAPAVAPSAALNVPTLSAVGLAALALLLGIGTALVRRRHNG
jgi:hypothetical protein